MLLLSSPRTGAGAQPGNPTPPAPPPTPSDRTRGGRARVMERPAPERREPRAENRPGVDEVGVVDDAFGERRTRLGHERLDQPVGESRRHLAGRLLGHLAAWPRVEAAAGLPAEVSRVDELDEAARRLAAGAEELADGDADVESHGVGELDRAHRHAERERRLVDGLGREPLVDRLHRRHQVRREHAIDQEARRALHRQRQLVDLRARTPRPARPGRGSCPRRRRSRPASSSPPG